MGVKNSHPNRLKTHVLSDLNHCDPEVVGGDALAVGTRLRDENPFDNKGLLEHRANLHLALNSQTHL